MHPAAISLLCVVLGILIWRATLRERRDYARFKRLRSTAARQKVYRRWLVESIIVLGGLSAAVLYAAWAEVADVLAEAQSWGPVATLREWFATPAGGWLAVGIAVAVVALLVVPILVVRGSLDEITAVGDIRALLPRTPGELPYGAALGLQAGVLEELLFRLGLPALVFVVTGDAVVAFVGTLAVFGLLHLYQGPLGILFATALGGVFTLLYLVTGSIWAPIALHVLIDLRSLVLIPIVIGGALTGSTRSPRPAPGRWPREEPPPSR